MIRLRNKARLYDFAVNLCQAVKSMRLRGVNVATFIPYKGAVTLQSVAVDSVAYPGFGRRLPKNKTHKRDGALVTIWYKAMRAPTARQIVQAERAVKLLKLPRKRLTGRLVDAFEHKGTTYILLMDVLERDHDGNRHNSSFRMLNVDDGTIQKGMIETGKAVRRKKKSKKKSIKRVKAVARKRRALKKKSKPKKKRRA